MLFAGASELSEGLEFANRLVPTAEPVERQTQEFSNRRGTRCRFGDGPEQLPRFFEPITFEGVGRVSESVGGSLASLGSECPKQFLSGVGGTASGAPRPSFSASARLRV